MKFQAVNSLNLCITDIDSKYNIDAAFVSLKAILQFCLIRSDYMNHNSDMQDNRHVAGFLMLHTTLGVVNNRGANGNTDVFVWTNDNAYWVLNDFKPIKLPVAFVPEYSL